MGTDIHPYAERRINGKWQRIHVSLPRWRNYVAFAVLANVRNGFGFAGVPTHEPLIPIAEPRGLPKDTAIKNHGEYEEEGYVWLGDHSFSYVTLAELKAYDLKQPLAENGVVSGAQRERVRAGLPPEEWCGAKSPMTKDDEFMEWSRPLHEAAALLPEWIKRLDQYKEDNYLSHRDEGIDQDIRVVFGFDS